MFLRTEKQIKKEQSNNIHQITCPYCSRDASYAVLLKIHTPIGPQYYHHHCAMDLVYSLLAVASGYAPDPEKTKLEPLE